MARTYTDIPEPRKVLEADTIRGYSRETVEEALAGGGSIPTFTVTINLMDNPPSFDAPTIATFDNSDDATAYVTNFESAHGIIKMRTQDDMYQFILIQSGVGYAGLMAFLGTPVYINAGLAVEIHGADYEVHFGGNLIPFAE